MNKATIDLTATFSSQLDLIKQISSSSTSDLHYYRGWNYFHHNLVSFSFFPSKAFHTTFHKRQSVVIFPLKATLLQNTSWSCPASLSNCITCLLPWFLLFSHIGALSCIPPLSPPDLYTLQFPTPHPAPPPKSGGTPRRVPHCWAPRAGHADPVNRGGGILAP